MSSARRIGEGLSSSDAVFANDLARFDAMFNDMDAVVTEPDGFKWVDPAKVPAEFMDAYASLVSYGYASGSLSRMGV